MVEEAFARSEPMVYLRHLPKGIWVRMEKYTSAPFSKKLRRQDNTLIPAETQKLVFVEVRTSDAFHFRNHTVTRTAFPCRTVASLLARRAKGVPWTRASSSTAAGTKAGRTRNTTTTGG